MNITTSNVNGIRAAYRKNVTKWVQERQPDVWCLQEVRAPQENINEICAEFATLYSPKCNGTLHRITSSNAHKASSEVQGAMLFDEISEENSDTTTQPPLTLLNDICEIKGRAGVATMSALPVIDTRIGLGNLQEPVDTGRWIEMDVQTPRGNIVTVVCVYVHAGNVDDDDKMRQKFRFLDAMTERLAELFAEAHNGGKQAVICGDYNIAHTPIDIARPKENEKKAGFLPEERVYLDRWLQEIGYVDVMRSLAGEQQGPYTWWSQRGKAFDNNVGWRIDYQLATPDIAETAVDFSIDRALSYDLRWSDHAALNVNYQY